jgi:N-acylglucosamine-6-phosphate 2-epimerase
MALNLVLDRLVGGIIVSCQAPATEPLSGPGPMAAFAAAAELGGAVAVRANGPADVAAIRARVSLPIIGIDKQPDSAGCIVITPSLEGARRLAAAGADMIAIEWGERERPGGITDRELCHQVRALGVLVMADVATFEDGLAAAQVCDLIGTTLAGPDSRTRHERAAADAKEEIRRQLRHSLQLPAIELIARLHAATQRPIVAEGRFWTPEQVAQAFAAGASAVVIGTAITRPTIITGRYVAVSPSGKHSVS